MLELFTNFGKFGDLHFFLLLDLVFVTLAVFVLDDQLVVFQLLLGRCDLLEVWYLKLDFVLTFYLPLAQFPHVK